MVERDSHVAIDCRSEIAWGDGAIRDGSAIAVGGADDLAMFEPTSGQTHRHDIRPMIPTIGAPLGPHHRRSPEFSHGNNQDVIQ